MMPEQSLADLAQREAVTPKQFDPRSATPKPGYLNKDEFNSFDLKEFCKFFNLKRWGEPVAVKEVIREIPVYVTPTAQGVVAQIR
jgi:hypothetical protein